jgi:hypothetical protein
MGTEIKDMLDAVIGVRKDWKEDWREDARRDWRLDFNAAAGAICTVLPAVTGNAWVGQVLSATTGTWTGTGLTYARQWRRNGTPIAAATAATYTLVLADLGASITCTVTATNTDGSVNATSNAVGPVLDVPANTVAPTITGTAQEGQTLTAVNGTWTGGSIVYTYQWNAGVAGATPISGATSGTYLVTAGEVGDIITVDVTATNAAGTDTVTTAATATVIAA